MADNKTDEHIPYLDAKLPVSVRVADLLARMTLEEKVGQLCMVSVSNAWQPMTEKTLADDAKLITQFNIGSFLNVIGERSNKMQEIAQKSTRLGIPVCFLVFAECLRFSTDLAWH
jgi:beta-glucosidase